MVACVRRRGALFTIQDIQVPIKTLDFDFITTAVFFSKCNFITYGCEPKMWILTNLSLILSGYCQIGGNRLDCEIVFLRM